MSEPLTKEQKRAAKAARAALRERPRGRLPSAVDVGCVIHGRAYDWSYVERLYNMVHRHLPTAIRFHVWTEHDRSVPPHMFKHVLTDWPGVVGPKKSWWYKLQMFDPAHGIRDLLYFDLDTVIVSNIDWIVQETTDHFWILRDFRYLQNPRIATVNSSVMWWNVPAWQSVWDSFAQIDIAETVRRYHGDQDFINALVPVSRRRMLPSERVVSWRWQTAEGGWDFRTRRPKQPGTAAVIAQDASVIVFHGRPKPHQIQDPVVLEHWR